MDPAATQSGLSSSDAAAATQPGSSGSLWPGGYSTPLMGAILGIEEGVRGEGGGPCRS